MSEEILINGKKLLNYRICFFEYCKLKKENKDLKIYIQKMDKPEIKTIDSEIALKNIELQQENEALKKKVKYLDAMTGIFSARLAAKYKQSLEIIREITEENIINCAGSRC